MLGCKTTSHITVVGAILKTLNRAVIICDNFDNFETERCNKVWLTHLLVLPDGCVCITQVTNGTPLSGRIFQLGRDLQGLFVVANGFADALDPGMVRVRVGARVRGS